MSAAKVHLHRDYHTAMCGKKAARILMTYDPKQVTCPACKAAKE